MRRAEKRGSNMRERGFTLLELLVAIGVLTVGLLAVATAEGLCFTDGQQVQCLDRDQGLTAGAVKHVRRLRNGILAISTYHPDLAPDSDRLTVEPAQANRRLPVFIAHGELDPLIPFSLAEQSRRAV